MFRKLGLSSSSSSTSKASNHVSTALTGVASGDHELVLHLHPDAHEDGGLSCNDDELLRQQQKAIIKWMKTMGQRLFSGNVNVLNTPFPVDMFEARSYLEKLADVWVYPRFLKAAALAPSPLERMRLTITWFIAGLYHSFERWKKPFNPILGETWQAALSDGSTIAMEQISHHPPVSAFQIEGPGSMYRFVGLSQPSVTIMLKAYGFKTQAKGYRYVEFADGSRITIDYPAYVMKGVVYSTRPRAEVEGTAVFVDAKHCLKAFVRFGSHKASGDKGLKRSDAIVGEIYDICGYSEPVHTSAVSVPRTIQEGDEEFESASETEWDMRDGASPDEKEHEPPVPLEKPSLGRHSEQAHEGSSSAHGRSRRHSGAHSGAPSGASTPPLVPPAAADDERPSKNGGVFSKMSGILGLSSGTSAPLAQEQSGTVLATLEGSWLSHLDFDGKRYWSLTEETPDEWCPVASPLASDCRFRKDLATLSSGHDIKDVQVAKEELEHLQRSDAKLRGGH
ncbi:hypothetical protein FOA52_005977 [Chlamydomonas sp. UWO 241]|nr:hypothetical protein FOA52_005977 [Chlamydomonas sp. UWO 241]